MKITTLIIPFVATAFAIPTTPQGDNALGKRGEDNQQHECPSNSVQPDGKLPEGSISTSALVPISAKHPNTTYPDTNWAKVTPGDFCTIFNFELDPVKTQEKVCTLVFDFPGWEQVKGHFNFYGSGKFDFTGYAVGVGAVAGKTTFNKQPAPGPSPPSPPPVMKPGHSYIVNSAPCGVPAGTPEPVTVSGSLCAQNTTLIYEQTNEGGCPLGFYVVLTDET